MGRSAALLAHRIASHFDAVGVVHQAVQDAVGGGGVADLFVPARDRELRSEDGRAGLIAILADFPEVVAFGFGQRSHGPVVDDENVDTAESCENATQAAVGAGDGQIAEQRGSAHVEQ